MSIQALTPAVTNSPNLERTKFENVSRIVEKAQRIVNTLFSSTKEDAGKANTIFVSTYGTFNEDRGQFSPI